MFRITRAIGEKLDAERGFEEAGPPKLHGMSGA